MDRSQVIVTGSLNHGTGPRATDNLGPDHRACKKLINFALFISSKLIRGR